MGVGIRMVEWGGVGVVGSRLVGGLVTGLVNGLISNVG